MKLRSFAVKTALHTERVADFLGETGIGVAGEYFHVAVGHGNEKEKLLG